MWGRPPLFSDFGVSVKAMNEFDVTPGFGGGVLLDPPPAALTAEQAIGLAAHLVKVADDDHAFPAVLAAAQAGKPLDPAAEEEAVAALLRAWAQRMVVRHEALGCRASEAGSPCPSMRARLLAYLAHALGMNNLPAVSMIIDCLSTYTIQAADAQAKHEAATPPEAKNEP